MQVFVVDDEKDVGTIFSLRLRKVLAENNIHFQFFNDPKELLTFLTKNYDNGKFLLFSDINMPEMDGLSLFKNLEKDVKKDIKANMKKGYISAYDKHVYSERIVKDNININFYFQKPLEFEEIEKYIAEEASIV